MKRIAMLAFALALLAGAQAVAASHGQGPAVSATGPHQKPCGKAPRRGCHTIEINSFQFGVGREITTPTSGASDREGKAPSIGELTVHKPKHKGH